jgi:hypothetical protein
MADAASRRTPRFIRELGRFASGNVLVVGAISWLAIAWLRLVFATNRWIVEPANAMEAAAPHLPAIAAVWHGQHVLLPAVPIPLKASVMISRSLDGEITARIARHFGAKPIRASGGRSPSLSVQKGGMTGFLEMLAALERGENVLQTADVPRGTPRRAGLGIVSLARRSGRPVIPLAVASSRRYVFSRSWDRTALNLPFGRSALCVGRPIRVAADAGPAELERARGEIEAELVRVTARAYELTGKPE